MTDDHDPYLLTLGQIASELTAIRQQLQRMNEEPADPDAKLPEYDCQHCSETLRGADAAKRHAVDDHEAPASDWRMNYRS